MGSAKVRSVFLMLAVSGGAVASDTNRATVNTESAPIYAETSRASAVVQKLVKGDVVTIAYTVATGEGDWCIISDRAGYVLCTHLTREEPPKPETEAIPAPMPAVITTAAPAAARPRARAPQAIPHPAAEPALFTPEQAALLSAAKMGNVTALQLALGKGAALNGGDKDGKTALMWAAYMGRDDAVKELLSAGADANAADSLGWTALEAAVWTRHPAALELLLEQGADANARDGEGRTPLMHAAQYGDLIMMRSPYCAACMSGVRPSPSRALASAPCSSSSSSAAGWRVQTAASSAVQPRLSAALASAPAESSSLTASSRPIYAAHISAVLPSLSPPFRAAPFRSAS